MNDVYKNKSKFVTFILCWLLGVFGVHRFYTGKVWTGILYLLTGGLCGIGVVVDMVMILLNVVKDSNKQPLKNDIPTFVIILLFIAWFILMFAFDVLGLVLGIIKGIFGLII